MTNAYLGTNIDGIGFSPDRLSVRGRDLVEMLGDFTFVEAVYHILSGRRPEAEEAAELDRLLVVAMRSLSFSHRAAKTTQLVTNSDASVARAMAAGLLANTEDLRIAWSEDLELGLLRLPQEGLDAVFYVGLMPALLGWAVGADVHYGDDLQQWRELDFLAALSLGAGISDAEAGRRILEDVLVAFHGGFGFLTPTVMLPRGAAGTGVPVPVALVAGFCAAGPNHLGACEEVMRLFSSLPDTDSVEARIREIRESGRPIPGIGHPLFEKDPRVEPLRRLAAERGIRSQTLELYNRFVEEAERQTGLPPNVDCIAAALLLSLGVPPERATGLILCARAAAMIAHVAERRQQPAFGAHRRLLVKRLQSISPEAAQYFLL